MIAALLVVSFAVAAVVVYSLVPRRRGKGSDEDEWVDEPIPVSPLAKLLAILIPIVLIGGLIAAVVLTKGPTHSVGPAVNAVLTGAHANGRGPTTHVQSGGGSSGGSGSRAVEAGILAGLGVLAVSAIFAIVWRRREGPADGLAPVRAAASAAARLSIDDLRRERDPRRAIVAAYARMEQVLAGAGVSRRPQETPLEYLRRVLTTVSAPSVAVLDLTVLFQEARFSRHSITSRNRDDALEALVRIRDALAP